MSDVPGKSRARLRKTHQDDVRTKIQATQLIKRVQDYAMGVLSDDEISANRLNAIKLLLNKSLPDLQSVELTGDADNPVAITEITRTIIRPK